VAGPPPLAPFGLVLHHDGRWTHEDQPILNRKLREKFDRSVRYLPDEDKYVVQVGRFRGEIEVEEAAFFVRTIDLAEGEMTLSDGSVEELEPGSLHWSETDGALLCCIGRADTSRRILARFDPSAHAELLLATEEDSSGILVLELAGVQRPLPGLADG
jgi:hypothetical protein